MWQSTPAPWILSCREYSLLQATNKPSSTDLLHGTAISAQVNACILSSESGSPAKWGATDYAAGHCLFNACSTSCQPGHSTIECQCDPLFHAQIVYH